MASYEPSRINHFIKKREHMTSETQAQQFQISWWAIAGTCIVGATLAACATQFAALVDIPGWAAAVMVGALTVAVIGLALARPGHRGKALAHQCRLLAGIVCCALALGAVQVLANLVGPPPEGGVAQSLSGLVATYVMVGGSLMLAVMAVVDARESRRAA